MSYKFSDVEIEAINFCGLASSVKFMLMCTQHTIATVRFNVKLGQSVEQFLNNLNNTNDFGVTLSSKSPSSLYTTKTHVIGAFAPPVSGHRFAKTLCNKKFSDMETCDGNGKTEALADQPITCMTCQKALAKLKKG